ncbi:MAG: hypothetical protein K9M57_06275 [Phycisphaerae bacterium]|nr:hypothetical protein [Phycisphaerae bacterium]
MKNSHPILITTIMLATLFSMRTSLAQSDRIEKNVEEAIRDVLDSARNNPRKVLEEAAIDTDTVPPTKYTGLPRSEKEAPSPPATDSTNDETVSAENRTTPEKQPGRSITEIAPVQDNGMIPSIVHQGDVVDFLRILSVACRKNIVPTQEVRGTISVNLFDVTCQEALAAVLPANNYAYEEKGAIILVYTQKEYDAMKEKKRKVESRVFPLNYISAQDALSMINPMLSSKGQITTSPKGSTGTAVTDAWAGKGCLIVVDYPEYLDLLERTLKNIDKQPVQVLVESTILVANLTDSTKFGINFELLGGVEYETQNGLFAASDSEHTNLNGQTTVNGTLSNGEINVGIVKGNLGMFINALENVTDVVSLGNPKVVTLNRQTGEVRVGRDEGYVTSESTATSTTQSIEMLQTGTTLKFTPIVMDDGFIRMELHPEDSTGQVTLKGAFALPEKTTTEVTTNILVKDGHTIVIGGLFREKTTLGRNQVPLLGNIPGLGHLFRSTDDVNSKEEVIFLITPHIVKHTAREYEHSEKVLDNSWRMARGARENLIGLSREKLANAHLTHAIQLREEGKTHEAIWNARMSAQISPLLLKAHYLCDELQARQIYEAESGSMQYFMKTLIQKDDELKMKH